MVEIYTDEFNKLKPKEMKKIFPKNRPTNSTLEKFEYENWYSEDEGKK